MNYHLNGPDICRAIDIGFGFVKFSKSHTALNWALDADSFPSLAPQATAARDVSGGELQRQHSVIVTADGANFCVGPDAMLAAPGFFTRILDNNYFRSPQYLALYRGALYYMSLPAGACVDFMTVGLPYTVYQDESLRAELITRLSGFHDLPARPGIREPRQRVLVRNVNVIPQVMGSLVAQTWPTNKYRQIQSEVNLTVDVGYGTMLWMVTFGLKADAARCGGNQGGVSSILQAVAAAIDPNLANDPRILDRLDRGLRDPNHVVKVRGAPIDLARQQRTIQTLTGEWLSAMIRSLGRTDDIDNVFLSGGGAYLYKELLKSTFPGRPVTVDDSACQFTNLRGFQMVAERRARERGAPGAAA